MSHVEITVRSPGKSVQKLMAIFETEPGLENGALIGFVVAVGILQEEKVRRLTNKRAPVTKQYSRREVQAIGGVNEKIEGFYAVCKARGISGKQGVMIPASNMSNLMLKNEVIDAVACGQFHIWSIATIEEGIEVLTGFPAGKKEDGSFVHGSIFERVNLRLAKMAEEMARFDGEQEQ